MTITQFFLFDQSDCAYLSVTEQPITGFVLADCYLTRGGSCTDPKTETTHPCTETKLSTTSIDIRRTETKVSGSSCLSGTDRSAASCSREFRYGERLHATGGVVARAAKLINDNR